MVIPAFRADKIFTTNKPDTILTLMEFTASIERKGGQMDKKKRDPYISCLQENHFKSKDELKNSRTSSQRRGQRSGAT